MATLKSHIKLKGEGLMENSTKHLSGNESGMDLHKEKDPGTGYHIVHDPTTENLKGQSPDRRAAKNRIPAPESSSSVCYKRWEH
jgi:hypothetical protein